MLLEGGFKRGGRIRVAERLRQIVPNRWATVRKRSFTKCVFTRGVAKFRVSDAIVIVLLEYKVEEDRTNTEGLFQRWD